MGFPGFSSPLLWAVHGPGHPVVSIFLVTFLLCPSLVCLSWKAQVRLLL